MNREVCEHFEPVGLCEKCLVPTTLTPNEIRERVARAICTGCGENPDHRGDARGNDYRWQDYLEPADAALDALGLSRRHLRHQARTNQELNAAQEALRSYEEAMYRTIDENRHLADGEDCTLIHLKRALRPNA